MRCQLLQTKATQNTLIMWKKALQLSSTELESSVQEMSMKIGKRKFGVIWRGEWLI